MKVGDSVWLYFHEKNVYDENRKYLGRGEWEKCEVTGETKQSWIVKQIHKIAKNDPSRTRKTHDYGYGGVYPVLYSEQEVSDQIWMKKNQYKISEAVRDYKCPATLKQIANLIGFETI